MIGGVSESGERAVSDTDTASGDLERKLATILSADVAGYSRLMAEDEEGTLQTFRGHKEVFERLVALHRGRIFNTAGDAILAEFGSAVEAVRCATEIQAALRTRNDQLSETRQVRFRIGVNLGDVMVHGADLLGDGVNVAARLQTAAEPGGICIAGSVYDQIRNKLSLSIKPLGEMSYKNIPQPVRTFAIAEADGLGSLPAPPTTRLPSAAGGISPAWAALAAVLVALVAGAAVWGYTGYRHRQEHAAHVTERMAAEEARREARAERHSEHAAEQAAIEHPGEAARLEALSERQSSSAARPTVGPNGQPPAAAQQNAQAEPPPIEDVARRLGAGGGNLPAPQQLAAVPPVPTPAASPAGTPPVTPSPKPIALADATGIYRGPICYGAIEALPARCYKAQAIVTKNRISGQWPAAIRGATMYLAGDITKAGDVAIHMHAQRDDGSHGPVADLVGKLHDGRIDANGSFLNGRTVKMNLQKD
jgi:class 3 adenylate cyclase